MSAYNLPPGVTLRDLEGPTRCVECGSARTTCVVVKPDGVALHYCADCAPSSEPNQTEDADE